MQHQLPLAAAVPSTPEVYGFRYIESFLPADEAWALFDHCMSFRWQRELIRVFGKQYRAPRLTAWYGDPGARYRYSGVTREAETWTRPVSAVRDVLCRELGARFNFVLANRYRDGNDCVGWHADDERDLGTEPLIASLSLGATRRFRIRRNREIGSGVQPEGNERRGGPWSIDMTHGSLLVMTGRSQADFKHALARTRRSVGERINLTFRWAEG